MDASGDVTTLLNSWRDGDQDALGRLMTIVYEQLRNIAHLHISRESPGQTSRPRLSFTRPTSS